MTTSIKLLLVPCVALAACGSTHKGDDAAASAGSAGSAGAGGSAPNGAAGSAGSLAGGGNAAAAGNSGCGNGGCGNGGSATTAGSGGVAGGTGGGGASGGEGGEAPFVLDFGPNVQVLDPATPMATLQGQIDAAYAEQFKSQFGDKRYAFLFKPGAYQLDVPVGYYTQALGLGATPDDVQITGAVRSTGINNGNATLSFWRGAENLSVVTPPGTPNMWAVSQGASFRRVHVLGSLLLADTGNSSGGFVADSKVAGSVTSASQQQYFLRNSEWAGWSGGVWNMVFSGDLTAPTGAWPASPYTVVAQTPAMAEKPFLFIDAGGKYQVQVPALRKNAAGISWGVPGAITGKALAIEQFYLAHEADTAATINAALDRGKHLLLTPGIYHLTEAIKVTKPGTVVLGLGLPTLVADAGTPAISVADVSGVRLAGVLVQAGSMDSPTLVEIGATGAATAHADDPTLLHDVYCRVGGAAAGLASSCMIINSHDVVADNLWLWRADHGTGAGWALNKSKNGLVVNGDNVTAHGLFVEHFQEYQTLWNGNGGHVFFYQSELPYDPPTQADWQHGTVNGYASYKVADSVTSHEAWGLGVYSAFRQAVVADNAIEAPAVAGVGLHHLVTVWLNGMPTSAINHIINGTGDAATMANRKATSAD